MFPDSKGNYRKIKQRKKKRKIIVSKEDEEDWMRKSWTLPKGINELFIDKNKDNKNKNIDKNNGKNNNNNNDMKDKNKMKGINNKIESINVGLNTPRIRPKSATLRRSPSTPITKIFGSTLQPYGHAENVLEKNEITGVISQKNNFDSSFSDCMNIRRSGNINIRCQDDGSGLNTKNESTEKFENSGKLEKVEINGKRARSPNRDSFNGNKFDDNKNNFQDRTRTSDSRWTHISNFSNSMGRLLPTQLSEIYENTENKNNNKNGNLSDQNNNEKDLKCGNVSQKEPKKAFFSSFFDSNFTSVNEKEKPSTAKNNLNVKNDNQNTANNGPLTPGTNPQNNSGTGTGTFPKKNSKEQVEIWKKLDGVSYYVIFISFDFFLQCSL